MSLKLKEKSEKELMKLLDEGREELRKFRFGAAGSSASNVKQGRELRKDIARILTEINFRKNTK